MNKAPEPTQSDGSRRELVVLLHGIASNRLVMVPLAWRLRRQGFDTRLWGYHSITGSNRSIGRRLARKLRRLDAQRRPDGQRRWDRIHLVVHSMGSIVTRCALDEGVPESVGRVVMIGPPNGGSHRATLLRFVFGFSRPLMELMDRPDSFVNRLPPPPDEVEIGVLAAKHDNVIHPERTHLPGERDHRFVNSWHTGALWLRETADLAANFLRYGRFTPPSQSPLA